MQRGGTHGRTNDNKFVVGFLWALLTERQRECYALHHEDDMSLGEIAEEFGISRQAVHDTIERAKSLMESYEEKLHLIEQYMMRRDIITEIKEEIGNTIPVSDSIYSLLAKLEG